MLFIFLKKHDSKDGQANNDASEIIQQKSMAEKNRLLKAKSAIGATDNQAGKLP